MKTPKEYEERYRTLFQSVPEGILISDIKTKKIKCANPAFCKMLGYTEEELRHMEVGDIHPKEDLERVFLEFNAQVQGEKTLAQDIPCLRKNGAKIYADIVTSPIFIDARDCHMGFFRDVTQRKKLEAQFIQAQKMEAIGTLTEGIAHDFNNLITVIICNAQLALLDIDKDNHLYKYIKEIKNAGMSAPSLTRQLLAYSRKQVVHPNVLDLNELLNDIEKMLVRFIGEDVEILTIPEPALWQVEVDPRQMKQVIMNLTVNAKDAMPRGGKLTIKTTNLYLDAGYFRDHGVKEKPGPYVMLAVNDTGIGMDKETLSHIFEPFFTTKSRDRGTGLGLSTVYDIVEQAGGFIWAYSEPGHGTTFKVYLPKPNGGAEPEEKEQTLMDKLNDSETVLVVEDDDRLRKLGRKVLERYGYRVLEAQDGEEALKVCKEHESSIQLMITDVVMPKMGGRELAKRLQPFYPEMKVIYMSGYTHEAIVHHGVLTSGLNFLEKPFTPKGLVNRVQEVLNQ